MDTSCKWAQYPNHDFCCLRLTSGRNQSITEVIQMNRSRDIRSRRILAFMAMLFGAIVTTMLVPAYGQQEVDPTWYDPYPANTPTNSAPHTVAVHSSQAPVAIHQHQTPLTSPSLSQGSEKVRTKQSTAAPKIRPVSIREPKQEEKVGLIARRRDQTY